MKIYSNELTLKTIEASVEPSKEFPYGLPVLLVGETGVGKTTMVRELANKHGKKLTRVNLNGQTGVEELIGKMLLDNSSTYWQDGILIEAMKRGDWIVFDEINAALPEVLFILNSLLDADRHVVIPEKDNELVKPHADFRFFATMNPTSDYSGTKDLNRALMSRFGAVIDVVHLEEDDEIKMLKDDFGVPEKEARLLVKMASVLRNAQKDDKIFFFCSTRDLIHTGQMLSLGFKEAVLMGIVNKAMPDERDTIKNLIKDLEGTSLKTEKEQIMEQMKQMKNQLKEQTKKSQELEKQMKDAKDSAGDINERFEEFMKQMKEKLSKKSLPIFEEEMKKLMGSKGDKKEEGDGKPVGGTAFETRDATDYEKGGFRITWGDLIKIQKSL